ncbi:hypothetical protein ACJIZ3_015198 [Penstemon smallii]|uniref:Translocon-associated protein subunit beta n=1 Tax=Penstemon smallii TaxID=265156 RepID=A0ABD3RUM3_9LAMI
MTKLIIGFAICILAALFFAPSTTASSEGPFIVAHKKASLTRLKSGSERVSVSIDVYNQGSATAYDLALNDDSWTQGIFEVVTGNTSVSWERLDAGALLSHTFELEAKTRTLFHGAPAIITFRIPTKSLLQEAYSTPIFPLDILADRPPVKKFDFVITNSFLLFSSWEWNLFLVAPNIIQAKKLLAKYGSFVSVVMMVVLFVYLVATPKSSGVRNKRKR